ncbi:hypothetical protein K373_05963 [Streptomyces sp. DvalAA-21]|nr:hypothetical protein SACTE_2912 [Streptomyces sp. SirexAA-E]PZX31431.1 hypothetical protein K373_05963 [Streptomyces sp. DvalAA-21]RAJ28186.1 hypothetical protein K351_05791 [Streptomyces sp. DpondAA-E10]RAJ41901.1 hypothetical protein K352_05782 [Streptomyces sp. DpondAA-A50]SCD99888.1 hypothetical protein GA0115235_11062 [Streptomyces sp. DpondAA-F4a]SCL88252.1 hypothetical protein SAMN04883147_1028118 [Streptomyces sp. DpondAA-F4]
MRHLLRRLHGAVRSTSLESTLPSFLLPQTTLLRVFAVRVTWGSLLLSVLVVMTSMGTFSVPSGALWALAAACAADQSMLMYQGYCRR